MTAAAGGPGEDGRPAPPPAPPGGRRGSVLFFADLHLDPAVPARLNAFAGFLDRLAQEGPAAVYILGDLFEVWTGQLSLEDGRYRPVFRALRALSDSGTALTVVKGNRDFLLDGRFAEATGSLLVEEGLAVPLGSRMAYLCHGDRLCTRDRGHQRMRWILRSAWLARLAADSAPWFVAAVARRLRRHSRETGGRRTERRSLAEIPPAEAARVLRGGFDVLIAGHVHSERRSVLVVDGRPREVYTLGAWEGRASVLVFDGERLGFQDFPFMTE